MSLYRRLTVSACSLFVALIAPIFAGAQTIPGTTCTYPPVEPCAIRHGRFSTQNGITRTIWLVGTRRRLDVTNEISDFLPTAALKYTEMTSPDHSYIFGDFTFCPVEPER